MNGANASSNNRVAPLVPRWLVLGLLAWIGCATGAVAAPPQIVTPPLIVPATAGSVPVEQSPLTIRKPIPPNIVLMLDDSGSMAQDVMPDWGYLSSHAQTALTDASVNGLYYNPAMTYTLPPKYPASPASVGLTYPASAFSAAPVNGFDPSATRPIVDLSSYEGTYDVSSSNSYSPPVEYPTANGPSKIHYSVFMGKAPSGAYDAPTSCPVGTKSSGRNADYCYYSADPTPSYFEFTYPTKHPNYWYVSKCDQAGYIYNKKTSKCLAEASVAVASPCPDGYAILGTTTVADNENENICVVGIGFFTYSVGGTSHYVGKYGSCLNAGLSSDVCVDPSQTSPTDPEVQTGMTGTDVLQNVANWFSYYHTRMLMARTGVMRAFADMDKSYRLGFASIDGSGASWIDTNTAGAFHFSSSNRLAEVAPFGDGSSGSRKAEFWSWMAGKVRASGTTPLRSALKAVGKYYESNQAWASTNPVTQKTDYLACRQSYVILTTDGFWNGGSPSVGDQDDNDGDEITGPNNNPYKYTPTAPFMDVTAHSDTLADVAMKYWKTDLMPATGTPSMANEVPTNNADPAFWQHMVTFTMGMGFTPNDADGNPIDSTAVKGLFQWSQTGTKPASLSSWGGWPEPSSGSVRNISDLVHAGVNGHGGFYSATDPQSFVSGLKDALQRAQQRTGTGASLAANSTQLNTGTMIYQGIYHTKLWTGDLNAYSVDPDNGTIAAAASWSAAAAMPAAGDRNIHTYVPGGATWTASSGTSVAFKNSGTATPPSLTTAQLDALGGDAAEQATMVNYLRGDNSNDQANNGTYRNRDSALGDIVDSQPVYLGAPGTYVFAGESFTGSSDYATFASNHASRMGLVYVAANDGMLHAFHARACITRDATTGACTVADPDRGEEVYAFLPGSVITHGGVDGAGNIVGVSALANPDYGIDAATPHEFFNDGQLTIAAAYFNSAWHTVLVGTTGRGLAKAIYALDVTDPSNIKFLWERSAWDGATNSGYIGQMVGQPVIAQVANGKWAVLIGNGYNSANGVAALLQFKLSDGTLSVYTTSDATTGNGLAAPAVWIGNPDNGISTVAYAGDLHGQVWSFVLGTSPGTVTKLFTTMDSDSNVQPITAGMLAGQDPVTGNRWIFFGTGRYLSSDDISDTSVQTWYGLIVNSSTSGLAVTSSDTRSDLAPRYIIAQTPWDASADPPILPARVVSPPDDANTQSIAGKPGWYMDLETPGMDGGHATDYANPVAEGERMDTPNQFQRGRLVATTRIPKSDDLCNPSGSGWVMAVDPFTGTNPKPQFFDVNSDGVIDSADMITVGGKTYPAAGVGYSSMVNGVTFVGSAAEISLVKGPKTEGTQLASDNLKRVSWREMVNP